MRFSHRPAAWSAVATVFILAACFSAGAQSSNRVPARVTEAVDPQKLVTLSGNVHPLARAENDRGLAADSQPLRRMLLVLKRSPQQEAALRQLLDGQQAKSQPGYHHWLTPQQFGQQFGPADSDVQAVTNWLASQGFEVTHVSSGRGTIEFSGTAGMVRQSLHTEIHQYLVDGEMHWANATNPQIPAALAPVVAGFASLNNFRRKPQYVRSGTYERSKATGEVKPLFTYTSSGFTNYAVGPNDFATIYNVTPLWNSQINGSGVAIAVVEDSNIAPQDVADFRSMFGLPATTPTCPTLPPPAVATANVGYCTVLNGPDPGLMPGASGDEGEADLDVEWAGAIAPGATVDLVVSETTEASFGGDLSAVYIVDNNLAPILSYSYGSCEQGLGASGNGFYQSLWEQAAAQGITVVVAAGDNGSAECDGGTETAAQYGLAVNGVSSTPFNVSVGGTDFNDASNPGTYWSSTNTSTTQASAMSYIPEIPWNDSACATASTPLYTTCVPASNGTDLVGGGGGQSNCIDAACSQGYAKPSWQIGTGVPSDSVRDQPDVALFSADGYVSGSFYIFCQMDANPSNTPTAGSASSCDLNSPYADFQGAGGTSFATPAFAGIMAMVIQNVAQANSSTAGFNPWQGNPNFVLYPLAGAGSNRCASAQSPGTSCIFYDIASGNNSVACQGGSPDCSSNGVSSSYGILVNPTLTTDTPAWLAGSGYDMATGLGSFNAANLVNNWSSVSFQPTSTSLTLSPTTFTHGASTSATVKVITTSGVGSVTTGDVSLIGCKVQTLPCPTASVVNNGGIDYNSLNNSNTVTWSTNFLPGGTYWVNAHYAGAVTNGSATSGAVGDGASDSSQVQVTVNPEGSETAVEVCLTATQTVSCPTTNSVTYGAPYVLRMDVTNSSGQQCSANAVPCPTGKVVVSPTPFDQSPPASNTAGTYPLNSQGYTEDQFVQYPAGAYSITGAYSGDNSYNSSTSPAYALTVAKATTSIDLTDAAQGGSTYALTATVSTGSNGAAPTGTMTFSNGTTTLSGTPVYTGTAANPLTGVNASATWVLTTTFTSAATVTATYSGDTNYSGSGPSNSVSITANPDFGLTATTTTATVTAGNSATYPLTVTSSFSFNSAVTLTCAVATPVGFSGTLPTCSVTSPVTPAANASATSTLTVSTTAQSLAPVAHRGPGPTPMPLPLPVLGSLAMLFLASMGYLAAKRRRALVGMVLAGMLLMMALGLASCGGGGGGGGGGTPPPTGTPSGTYSITVTGTSGSLSHQVSVSLVVQ